ncbi:MAG: SGNH/GDSL hydrolase family protein, partial [Caldilineaceae bacterium]
PATGQRYVATSAGAYRAVNGPGSSARTVLFCDSMTDWYHFGGPALASAVYDAASGVLTLTYSAAHLLYSGVGCRIWHYGYTALRDQVYVPLERVSNTVMRAQMGALPGVPSGVDISSGLCPYLDNVRAAASWVNWIQMTMGWPLRVVRNAGQSGDVSAGNLRRLQRDILAFQPALVLGQLVGINDRNADAGVGRPEDEVIANNTALLDGILAAGAQVCVGTMTPVSAGEARASRANMLYVLRMNDWLRDFARSRSGLHVVDHYRHVIDIADANGLGLASRLRNDNIHFATKTVQRIARDWQPLIQRLVPTNDSTLPKSIMDCHPNSRLTVSSATAAGGVVTVTATAHQYRATEEFRALGGSQAAANGWFRVASATTNSFTYLAPGVPDGAITGLAISRSRNLFVNPLLQTTTGGTVGNPAGNTMSGTVASGLATTNGVGTGCTAVSSVASAANVGATALGFALPLVGNEQVVAVSAASAGNRVQFTNSGTAAFATQMLVGRSYVFECVLRLSSTDWNATALSQLLAQMTLTMDAGALFLQVTAVGAQDISETAPYAEDMRLHLRTPPLTVNAGATISQADFLIAGTVQAAFTGGPVLTLGLSQLAVHDVTGSEALYL